MSFRSIPFSSVHVCLMFWHLWGYLHRISLEGRLVRLGCPIPGPFAEGCATRHDFPTLVLKTAHDGRVPSKAQDTNTNLRRDSKPNCKGRLSCGGRALNLSKSETGPLERPNAAQPSFGGADGRNPQQNSPGVQGSFLNQIQVRRNWFCLDAPTLRASETE